MERAVVLTQGGGQPQASPALGDLITQYSSILASQVIIIIYSTVLSTHELIAQHTSMHSRCSLSKHDCKCAAA